MHCLIFLPTYVEPPTVAAAGATVEATPATVPANAPTNPVPTGSNRDDDELQPLLAGWLKDRQAFLDTVGRALHRNAHRASWHGLRLPLYALRLVVLAPRGAGRVLRALFLFLSDAEGRPLRVDAVTESDAATWLRLRKERNERVRRRLIVAGTLTAPVALLVLAMLWPAVAAGEPSWDRERLGFRPPRLAGRRCQHTCLPVQSVSGSRWTSGFFRGCTSAPTRPSHVRPRVARPSSGRSHPA